VTSFHADFKEMREKLQGEEEKLLLLGAFKQYDENSDGQLQREEVEKMFSEILKPLHLTASELEEEILDLLALLDRDLDGKITFDELHDIWWDSEEVRLRRKLEAPALFIPFVALRAFSSRQHSTYSSRIRRGNGPASIYESCYSGGGTNGGTQRSLGFARARGAIFVHAYCVVH
jgi:hypothetical protein